MQGTTVAAAESDLLAAGSVSPGACRQQVDCPTAVAAPTASFQSASFRCITKSFPSGAHSDHLLLIMFSRACCCSVCLLWNFGTFDVLARLKGICLHFCLSMISRSIDPVKMNTNYTSKILLVRACRLHSWVGRGRSWGGLRSTNLPMERYSPPNPLRYCMCFAPEFHQLRSRAC